MRNETNAVSLHCRHCRGSGVLVTRWTLGGEPLKTEDCDRCAGRGVKQCDDCEKADAVTRDDGGNAVCARCAVPDRATERNTPEDEAIDRHLEAWKEMRAEARRAS